MGWMQKRGKVWGDEPQDAMDMELGRKFGKGWYDRDIPLDKGRRVVRSIMANKSLRTKIDKIYKRVWNRKATNAEYKGLIWGISSIKKGKSL